MGKLLLHIIVATGVIATGRRLDWPSWIIIATVIAGAVVVHIAYDQFLGGPTRHLGASAIANDDPLLLAALEESKQTWPQFLALFAQRPTDSLVKYRLATKAGDIENVWGDLLELNDDVAKVFLRTPPSGGAAPDPRMTIPVTDIIDWQVMLPDGTLRGGFTQQATFRIMERDNGPLPRKFVQELARYRPVSDPSS